jgi:hypothetical protein
VSEPVTEGRTSVDYRRQHLAAQVPHPQHLRGREWSGVSRRRELKIRVSGVQFPPWPLHLARRTTPIVPKLYLTDCGASSESTGVVPLEASSKSCGSVAS